MLGQKSISVLIPFYNTEKYLAEAIQSVTAQTLQPMEILLLDDGSTDGSAKIAESFKPQISLFYQKNAGISAARNKLVKKAKGDFLAFLDADDLWPPDHLKILFNPFRSNKELGIVSGHVEQFLSPDVENLIAEIPDRNKVLPGYVMGTFLIKKEVFKEVGHFNEELTLADTVDWFARVKDRGIGFKMVDDIVLRRRIHTTNTGINQKGNRHDYTKALMASIKRKRERENSENE
jgi:glycosyltransferase involved in cell wall biosynthesis